MKNNLKISMLVLCCFIAVNLFSQTENALMPGNLMVNDIVRFDTSGIYSETNQNNLFLEVTLASSMKGNISLASIIIDGITKKNIPVYYKDITDIDKKKFEQLTPKQINNEINNIDTLYVDTNGDGATDTIMTYKNEYIFKKLMFEEKWSFDEQQYKMQKDIIAYWPVSDLFKYFGNGEKIYVGYRYWGAIIADQNTKSNFLPLLTIKYEYILENEELMALRNDHSKDCFIEVLSNSGFEIEMKNSPLFTSYSRNKLKDLLVDPVMEGKIAAYDFYTGKQLSKTEIEKNLMAVDETVNIDTDGDGINDKSFVYKKSPQKEEIRSVIFVEEWFIDPANLTIQKKVKAIAPVINLYKYSESKSVFFKKNILYFVKLN